MKSKLEAVVMKKFELGSNSEVVNSNVESVIPKLKVGRDVVSEVSVKSNVEGQVSSGNPGCESQEGMCELNLNGSSKREIVNQSVDVELEELVVENQSEKVKSKNGILVHGSKKSALKKCE